MLKHFVIQDYIKTITAISLNEQRPLVKHAEIAAQFGISTAAVSDMVKKLVREKLVINHSHKGIELTASGLALGKKMIRRHRLWESFLHEVLNLPWHKVHHEAEHLEHAGSDELIDHLDEFLKFPSSDPHGNPIPDKDGRIVVDSAECPLSEAKIAAEVELLRFIAFDPEYLDFMSRLGLKIGTKLRVREKLDFDNSIRCELDGKDVVLTQLSAQQIYVRPVPGS